MTYTVQATYPAPKLTPAFRRACQIMRAQDRVLREVGMAK